MNLGVGAGNMEQELQPLKLHALLKKITHGDFSENILLRIYTEKLGEGCLVGRGVQKQEWRTASFRYSGTLHSHVQ